MVPSREDPGQNLLTGLNYSGGRGLGCARQCLHERKVQALSPLLLGSGFGVHFWGPPWSPEFFARTKGKLGFVPVGRGCVWGGLASFLEIGQLSLAVGQWGRGSWVGDVAPRLQFRWAAVSWFLRNPVFVAGYSHRPLPTPSPRAGASTFL